MSGAVTALATALKTAFWRNGFPTDREPLRRLAHAPAQDAPPDQIFFRPVSDTEVRPRPKAPKA